MSLKGKIPPEVKIQAVEDYLAIRKGSTQIREELGIRLSTFQAWLRKYQMEGRSGLYPKKHVIGITARGTGSSRTARAGIACVIARRRREYDGHITARDSTDRHAAGSQIGGKIGTCSKGICAGAAKGRRDKGCVFAYILILHCPTICRVNYLNRSRIPVIRISGGINAVVQGAGRQGQCRRQAKHQASGNYSFHSLSSSVVSWRRFINKAAPVPAPTRATIPKGTAMANQLNWAGPVLSSSVGTIGSSGVPSKIAT